MSDRFEFWEKDDVPFAFDPATGAIFRMDGRERSKWIEIDDSDSRCRIRSNSSTIPEAEAFLLSDEQAADIAALG